VYMETCTYGSEASSWKPTVVIRQGAGYLAYAFIGSKSSSTALKTVSSLAENYDGMMLGFQLSK
ncbi:DUF4923 family protein, partial [Bacteroides sp.]|uniref:lipocalin-like domain-containing protein n=1 Tax=Bacteroides sp. TaxID=29523 RepID=UPI00258FF07D